MKKSSSPRLRVELTSEGIEAAKQRDSSHCMIAEAVKAAFPGAAYVSVDLQTIRFSDPEKHLRYTYLTPRSAQIALVNFDQGREPEPFAFRLSGGQVTRSGQSAGLSNRRPNSPLTKTEADKAAKLLADGASDTDIARAVGCSRSTANRIRNGESLAKQKLVSRGDNGPRSGPQIPERIGGKTPPLTPFARRRQFGLRALER